MAGTTPRWGLSTLGTGDTISADGFKFSNADRMLIDRLLEYAVEQHHHTGTAGTDNTPATAPTVTLLTVGGAIPSGARYYYRYTYIDAYGFETAPSSYTFADTPRAVDSPQAPTLSFVTGSGSLLPGYYSYVLSAYTTANTLETKAINSSALVVTGTNLSNEISLILPALPSGASGYNVYRKTPSGMHYLYLTSIASPTPLQVWTDDGSLDEDCNRTLPTQNLTSNTNAITVSLPGSTPALPGGIDTWRIYRSIDPNNWERSFLTTLTKPQGGSTPTSYADVGGSTTEGTPPSMTRVFNAPEIITIGTETTGVLPSGRVISTETITFTQTQVPEVLAQVKEGAFNWICEFDEAYIISCRAYLAPTASPASQSVIVDVHKKPVGESNYTTIYTTQANRPSVGVGANAGAATTPNVRTLEAGDELRIDIDQVGGGSTPTDYCLSVNVFLYVKHGSETDTTPWT
jgi:hypothetical protein